jgi:hypothetical protein
MQAVDQHVADERVGRLRGETLVEAQHHHLVDAAALELGELVAQRRDARRRGLGLAGGCGSKVSTQLGTPRWRASLVSSASIAWCPRCTPSKLPMVSAQAFAMPG